LLRDHKNSPDESVIAKAQELNAILLSLNGDFADIVRYPPAQFDGIVALQIRDHPEIIPPPGATPMRIFGSIPRRRLLLWQAASCGAASNSHENIVRPLAGQRFPSENSKGENSRTDIKLPPWSLHVYCSWAPVVLAFVI
jgi:hypothetical protein